jgi:sugar-specific transcriptional regulator TrmB
MVNILAKLNASNHLAGRVLSSYPSSIPREEVDRINASLIFLKGKLDEIKPELFHDYLLHSLDAHLGTDNRYHKMALEKIRMDLSYLIDVINHSIDFVSANVNVTKQGVFFAGEYFDALYKIGEIIEKAQNEIIIIDSYLNEKIVRFIKSKNTSATLTLVVSKSANTDSLKMIVEAAHQQFGKIQTMENSNFHDRFVILDKNEVYHFGASLKDVGKRGFMFSMIEENSIKENFFDQLKKEGIL